MVASGAGKNGDDASEGSGGNQDILPRPRRRRKKTSEDRGLPPDEQIRELARVYLTAQRKHWPKLAEKGTLPEPTTEMIDEMVSDYKHRHRGGPVDFGAISALTNVLATLKATIGGGYSRFSCDNSNPTSIIDQLTRWLLCAANKFVFVPWSYVFSDYSVSGLDSARRGYQSYKQLLGDKKHLIQVTFIDDFTRASRDELEWWKLASLSKRLKKGLYGASDSFDLNSESADVLMYAYSMLSKLFIRGLRQKVMRGMQGASLRGGVLGKLPLGFTRKKVRDLAGNLVYRANGKQAHEPAWDLETLHWVREMFRLFVEERRSAGWIARHFVAHKVDGWEGWTRSSINLLLANPAYLGIFIWNRTRREWNAEDGVWEQSENPRKEWNRVWHRHLQVISIETWRQAQRRLSEIRRNSPLTGRKMTRNQISASTLFSGTLFCGYCHADSPQELQLARSTEKYKNMWCINGRHGIHNCKLTTSKSIRPIEKTLLGYLTGVLCSDDAVALYVEKANIFLAEEQKRPRQDSALLRAEERSIDKKIKKLVRQVESEDDDALCQGYHSRIKELQTELNKVRRSAAEIERQNAPVPPPLDVATVRSYLADLPALLNQQVPAAAEAIRSLTGPIHITQEKIPGRKRGANWIATFSPDLTRFLAKHTADQNYPESVTLGYLCARFWIKPESVRLVIKDETRYELLASVFREMHAQGMNLAEMAREQRLSWEQARVCLEFAVEGKRPQRKQPQTSNGRRGGRTIYLEYSAEVAQRFDVQKQPFERIAKELGIGLGTVMRAYDEAHPEIIAAARASGGPPKRGRNPNLPKAIFETIAAMLDAGERSVERIAVAAKCSINTVYREMTKLGVQKRSKRKGPQPPRPPKVKPSDYRSQVVEMHDVQGLSFSEISRRLKVCYRTVQKAYDLGRPDILGAAAASGEPPQRSKHSRLSDAEHATIRAMIQSGSKTSAIVRQVGCSQATVNAKRLNYLRELIQTHPEFNAANLALRTGCKEKLVRKELERFGTPPA